ncbi:hypothetical protein K1719_036998 [Acacia pycnantha]|nr:hypothetical protein K1719_036998 [Acacia pycnantha]
MAWNCCDGYMSRPMCVHVLRSKRPSPKFGFAALTTGGVKTRNHQIPAGASDLVLAFQISNHTPIFFYPDLQSEPKLIPSLPPYLLSVTHALFASDSPSRFLYSLPIASPCSIPVIVAAQNHRALSILSGRRSSSKSERKGRLLVLLNEWDGV